MTGPAHAWQPALPGARDEVIKRREAVLQAALKVISAERELDGGERTVTALLQAEDRIALAARDYVAAVDALPPGRKPKGWAS